MAETCYVRYPDAKKDDPKGPGTPNAAIEISLSALDDHRARGFVQCEADGSAVKSPIPAGAGPDGADPVKLATDKDDAEALKVRKVVDEDTAAVSSATGSTGSTGGGN